MKDTASREAGLISKNRTTSAFSRISGDKLANPSTTGGSQGACQIAIERRIRRGRKKEERLVNVAYQVRVYIWLYDSQYRITYLYNVGVKDPFPSNGTGVIADVA